MKLIEGVDTVTVYAIAQLKFTERAAYDRYQAHFMDVFSQFEGTLLAADEAPRLIEGESTIEKIVLMSFPGEPAFRRWADSPEYRRIVQDRLDGANTVVFLIDGLK